MIDEMRGSVMIYDGEKEDLYNNDWFNECEFI
jgi:hypothetical protein